MRSELAEARNQADNLRQEAAKTLKEFDDFAAQDYADMLKRFVDETRAPDIGPSKFGALSPEMLKRSQKSVSDIKSLFVDLKVQSDNINDWINRKMSDEQLQDWDSRLATGKKLSPNELNNFRNARGAVLRAQGDVKLFAQGQRAAVDLAKSKMDQANAQIDDELRGIDQTMIRLQQDIDSGTMNGRELLRARLRLKQFGHRKDMLSAVKQNYKTSFQSAIKVIQANIDAAVKRTKAAANLVNRFESRRKVNDNVATFKFEMEQQLQKAKNELVSTKKQIASFEEKENGRLKTFTSWLGMTEAELRALQKLMEKKGQVTFEEAQGQFGKKREFVRQLEATMTKIDEIQRIMRKLQQLKPGDSVDLSSPPVNPAMGFSGRQSENFLERLRMFGIEAQLGYQMVDGGLSLNVPPVSPNSPGIAFLNNVAEALNTQYTPDRARQGIVQLGLISDLKEAEVDAWSIQFASSLNPGDRKNAVEAIFMAKAFHRKLHLVQDPQGRNVLVFNPYSDKILWDEKSDLSTSSTLPPLRSVKVEPGSGASRFVVCDASGKVVQSVTLSGSVLRMDPVKFRQYVGKLMNDPRFLFDAWADTVDLTKGIQGSEEILLALGTEFGIDARAALGSINKSRGTNKNWKIGKLGNWSVDVNMDSRAWFNFIKFSGNRQLGEQFYLSNVPPTEIAGFAESLLRSGNLVDATTVSGKLLGTAAAVNPIMDRSSLEMQSARVEPQNRVPLQDAIKDNLPADATVNRAVRNRALFQQLVGFDPLAFGDTMYYLEYGRTGKHDEALLLADKLTEDYFSQSYKGLRDLTEDDLDFVSRMASIVPNVQVQAYWNFLQANGRPPNGDEWKKMSRGRKLITSGSKYIANQFTGQTFSGPNPDFTKSLYQKRQEEQEKGDSWLSIRSKTPKALDNIRRKVDQIRNSSSGDRFKTDVSQMLEAITRGGSAVPGQSLTDFTSQGIETWCDGPQCIPAVASVSRSGLKLVEPPPAQTSWFSTIFGTQLLSQQPPLLDAGTRPISELNQLGYQQPQQVGSLTPQLASQAQFNQNWAQQIGGQTAWQPPSSYVPQNYAPPISAARFYEHKKDEK
jgi:hypothetical protein